jgi:hydrogenase maturation protein HypF
MCLPICTVPEGHNVMSTSLPCVLACGAWLKNTACLVSPTATHWSPLFGDLSDPEACRALDAWVRAQMRDTKTPVAAIAHDLHPDFFSSQLARILAEEYGIDSMAVQHHHAHIAAIMAEHGVNEPVVGLALDGVGLGTDGQAWGGELLWVGRSGWERLGHLQPLALPGGDVAAREPWRMAASALYAMGRGDEILTRFGPQVGESAARMVQHMLTRQLNSPFTSSTGRWFDAAAACLGLCLRQSHEAEAAIALEQLAATATPADAQQGLQVTRLATLDLRPLLLPLLNATDIPAAALWFHHALADALVDWATLAAQQKNTSTVCLGGGCFMNRLLTARLHAGLTARGLRVLQANQHSCGDAGLALGQAWVAAHQLAHQSQRSLSCA